MSDQNPQPPPGWYPAPGDPAGTQRYWDGAAWQGGPQPIGGAPGGQPAPQDSYGAGPAPSAQGAYGAPGIQGAYGAPAAGGQRAYADWGTRFLATLIDAALFIPAYLAVVVLVLVGSAISDVIGGLLAIVGYLGIIAIGVYIFGWLPGITGQTPGKRIMGYEIVREDTGRYLGGGAYIGRYLIGGFVNGLICYIGWLWPLWDAKNQTWSDKIFSSIAVTRDKGSLMPVFPDGKPF